MTDAKPSRTITSRENIRNEPRTHTRCINPWARAGLFRLVLRQSIAIPSGSPVSLRTPPSTRLDSLSVRSLYRFYPGTSRGENNPAYPVQNRPEQFTRNGDFCQLERHVSSVTDYLRPDLDQLVSERRQRPMAYPLRQRQPTEEIAEIVRQGEQLQAYLIVHEVMTGEPRPVQGVLPLL